MGTVMWKGAQILINFIEGKLNFMTVLEIPFVYIGFQRLYFLSYK